MIKINKDEKEYLLNKGFKWGETIHRTYSGHTHYYATESPKAMSAINKYRQSRIVK